MLEIKPFFNINQIAQYSRKCCRIPDDSLYLYLAKDGDETLAAGLFEVQSNKVSVLYYEAADSSDHFLFDGILRAGLNYASGQGIENGYIPESFRQKHAAHFSKLNYPPEPELNIMNFFNKYKNCTF